MRPKPDMDLIREKTEELCLSILNQPTVKELRKMIDDFANNDAAIIQYNQLMKLQQMLQQKQQHGLTLTKEELDDFEQERHNLFTNPVTRDFMYAQQEFGKIQDLVNRYVMKTIELDRIPEESDLEDSGCGCGGNCSCGGHH